MKLCQLSLRVIMAATWVVVVADSAFAQSGNMSDITLPSPDAMVSEPPTSSGNEGQTPAEGDMDVVEGQTPTEGDVDVVDGQTPAEGDVDVVDGQTPAEGDVDVVDGQTPVEGDSDVVDGQTPAEGDADVVEGQTPAEGDVDVVEGQIEDNTPDDSATVGENSPSEDADAATDTTAQDLEFSKNTTDNINSPSTEEGSIESNDGLNSESVNIESEAVRGETVTSGEDTVSTETEIGASENLDSQSANTEPDTTAEEGVTSTQNEATPEAESADGLSSDRPDSESANTESNLARDEEATSAQDNEPTVSESRDSLDTKPANTESADGTEKTSAQDEVTTEAEAQASSEAQASEESSEIIDELIEEAELKEKLSASEAEEEAIAEETEEPTEESSQTEEEAEEEVAEEPSEPDLGQLDRVAYETQFQDAPNDLAILMQEEFQLTQLIDSSGLELYGTIPSVRDISRRLTQLAQQTGKKPAFINISLQSNQLESFVVLPEQTQANASNSVVASSQLNVIEPPPSQSLAIRKTVKETSRRNLLATATQFREEVSDIRKLSQAGYMESAQELYKVLIEPIEAELEANDIDILVFSMDSGLRLLPLAALHDGNQFLVEKYAMGMVPSFGLTDTRYVSPEQSSILAMGASEFEEQASLPTMPIELNTIVSNPRQGELFLNEQFTISNFVAQNSRETPFSIIHLGTHAEFKAGNLNDSYIQFYDDKLKIPQLQKLSDQLGWNTSDTPIELLVLSACETALGDKDAELGFAGLAVQAGVKSALASLWYVSDLGTLALMGEFYDQLGNTLIKAEALRQTQLEMIRGNVKVNDQLVNLSNGNDLPLPEDFPKGTLTLDHPYFWSSFTLIGNWN